jgi:subtilisin-like proprotein convertase family protein
MSMSKVRLLLLAGLMTAAMTPLYGCGSECAEGTTEKDGQCVVAANGCAEGTALRSGECTLDTTGCGPNTVLEGGACVPATELCEGDTTFDEDTRTCLPDTDVLCGAGTELAASGKCAPTGEACAETTSLDENGRCVVAAPACGAGTELEPTAGECVLAAEGCGDGLAIDADSGTCISTDEVCDAGTRFDDESGLCLNDSCSLGDVLIDGVCMLPAEDLASNPDLEETENNDPAYGGTANTLFVNSVGGEPYIFSGAIGEPIDLDNDGQVDQDVDVFDFDAQAGEWFEITVQSLGLQAPAFVVEGPNDFVRYSPIGRARDAARGILAPADGVYTVTVMPSMVLQAAGPISSFGGADWTYVGTLGLSTPPDAAQIDVSSGEAQITGDYLGISDNFFELTNLESTDLVRLDVNASGSDATGVLQQWESSSMLTSQETLASGASVEVVANAGGSALLLFDWISLDGPASEFDVTAKIVGSEVAMTMLPGDTETYTVSAQERDYVVAGQSNASDAELDVTITDSTGTEVAAGALASDNELRYLTDMAGDFTITFTNSTSSNVDATLTAKAVGLPVIGPLAAWDSQTYASPGTVPYGETRLHKLIVTETGTLNLTLVPSASSDYTYVTLFDSTMTEVVSGDRGLTVPSLSPGTYFVEVEPEYTDISYTMTTTLFGTPDFTSEPSLPIPDNTLPGVTDTLSVSGCSTVSSIEVFVDISHSYRGDIVMSLTNPSGTSVTLHDGTGGGDDNLVGVYPSSLTAAESLSAFVGGGANGSWALTIGDDAGSDTGTLNSWGLNLNCQ